MLLLLAVVLAAAPFVSASEEVDAPLIPAEFSFSMLSL
jgi:biopolymer transport protein ExbD